MVYFGTGQYLESADNSSTGQTTQSFYGIWDRNENSLAAFTRDHLLKQEILFEVTAFGFDLRVSSDYSINWHPTNDPTGLPTVPVVPPNVPTHLGWYLDLINTEGGNTDNLGERQVSNSILRNGRIIFTTLVPSSDVCEFGGTSWLMELDADTGSRLPFTPFDLNGDKKFSNADYVTVNINGNDVSVPVSGKKSTVGVTSSPGILQGPGGDEEFKYTSGSSGAIESHVENPGPLDVGRQSWLQF